MSVVHNVQLPAAPSGSCTASLWRRFPGIGITMSEAKPAPHQITLYLSPYLRLYVLAKLGDRDRAANDVDARALWLEMGQLLGGRLIQVENDYEQRPVNSGKVVMLLELRDGVSLEPNANGRQHRVEMAQAVLQRRYLHEMYHQVDWYRSILKLTARNGLELFREQYAVSEDDHAFATAERLYQRYCQRNGKSRPYRRRNGRIRAKAGK